MPEEAFEIEKTVFPHLSLVCRSLQEQELAPDLRHHRSGC